MLLTATFFRLDWRAVAAYVRRPGLAVFLIPWLLFVTPVVVWSILEILDIRQSLKIPIVLMAAAPPIISSVPFAQLLRLNPALAAISVFAATILVPVTLPIMAFDLLGLKLELGSAALMARLAIIAGGALLLAIVLRRLCAGPRRARANQFVDSLSILVLVVFAVAIMDGVTEALVERPAFVLGTAAAAIAANIGMQAAGAIAFARAGIRTGLTAGLLTGNRNMALLMAALAGSADFDLMLYFAVGQIPIYILPALLAPLYERILARTETP